MWLPRMGLAHEGKLTSQHCLLIQVLARKNQMSERSIRSRRRRRRRK